MTFAAKYRPADLRLERHLVVFAAVIANYLVSLRRIFALTRLFGAALRTPLRGHHVALIKDLLFFFGEKKSLFTLHADGFNIGHRTNLLVPFDFSMQMNITQIEKLSRKRKRFNMCPHGLAQCRQIVSAFET